MVREVESVDLVRVQSIRNDFSHEYSLYYKRLRKRLKVLFFVKLSNAMTSEKLVKSIDRLKDDYFSLFWSRLPYSQEDLRLFDWMLDAAENYFAIYFLKRGKEEYLSYLIKKYYEPLRKHAFFQLKTFKSSVDDILVDEIVSKTFSRLMVYVNSYNPYKSSLLTWLKTIADNIIKKDVMMSTGGTVVLEQETAESISARDCSFENNPAENMSPEEAYEKNLQHDRILSVLFNRGGYPWQIICYCLLMTGLTPETVSERYSDWTVSNLLDESFKLYSSASEREDDILRGFFEPLYDAMEMNLTDVLSKRDQHSRRKLSDHLGCKLSELTLSMFYAKDSAKSISEWKYRVSKKILKELIKE